MVELVIRTGFTYARSDLRHPDSDVAKLKRDSIVWWYGNFRTPKGGSAIPRAALTFRTLYNDVPGPFVSAVVPLSSLPHYQVGTIWREGQCLSDTLQTVREFQVDFAPGGWSLTSRAELVAKGQAHTFPEAEYALHWHNRDQCKLLVFPLPNEKQLIIPCIEFFLRAYFRNIQANRLLTTKTWSGVMENFFSTQAKSETNWRVEPTAKMRKYDSTLLSHILYDPYTEKVAKRFNAQFISKPPETRIFPEVEPWFRGPATVRCKGRWVNNGNTFLCLSLIGCSVPKGPIIEWITPEFDSTDGIDGAGRFILPQSVRTAEEEELLHEESFLEPDGHAETTIVRVPPFESIGTPRTIISSRKTIKGNKSNVGPQPPKAETFADAEGSGTGRNVGKLEHVAEAPLESHGFLHDIWNAFKSLQPANSERISEVNWYTPNLGFQRNDNIQLIQILPIEDPSVDHEVRIWPHTNRDTSKQRGIMAIRIKIDNYNYFCLEIQRDTIDKDRTTIAKYAGALITEQITYEALNELLERICTTLPYALGRFKRMRSTLPKNTIVFKHTHTTGDVIYRQRLINIFKEMKINLE